MTFKVKVCKSCNKKTYCIYTYSTLFKKDVWVCKDCYITNKIDLPQENEPHKSVITKENNQGNIKPLLSYDQSKQLLRLLEKKHNFEVKQLEAVYYSMIELKFIKRGFY